MLAVAQPHIDENGELVEPFDPTTIPGATKGKDVYEAKAFVREQELLLQAFTPPTQPHTYENGELVEPFDATTIPGAMEGKDVDKAKAFVHEQEQLMQAFTPPSDAFDPMSRKVVNQCLSSHKKRVAEVWPPHHHNKKKCSEDDLTWCALELEDEDNLSLGDESILWDNLGPPFPVQVSDTDSSAWSLSGTDWSEPNDLTDHENKILAGLSISNSADDDDVKMDRELYDEFVGVTPSDTPPSISKIYQQSSGSSLIKKLVSWAEQKYCVQKCTFPGCGGLFCNSEATFCKYCSLKLEGKTSDDSFPPEEKSELSYENRVLAVHNAIKKDITEIVMAAAGIEENEEDIKETIHCIVAQGSVPKMKRFLFSIHNLSKKANQRVSFVCWTIRIFVDLVTTAVLENSIDTLLNTFITDELLAKLGDTEQIELFAGIAFSIEFGVDQLSRVMQQSPVVKAPEKLGGMYLLSSSRYHGKSSIISTLFRSNLTWLAMRAAICTGFCPFIRRDSQTLCSEYPFMTEFFLAACNGSKEVLGDYIMEMFPKTFVDVDDVIVAVYSDLRKAVNWFPLYFIAFVRHLQQTALKLEHPFVTSLVSSSSAFATVVDLDNPRHSLTSSPTPSHFHLKMSPLFETSFIKVLISSFGALPLSRVLRSEEKGEAKNYYSFNFSKMEKQADLATRICEYVSENAELMEHPRIAFAIKQLVEVASSSNKDGIATAKATACLVSGAKLCNLPLPVLKQG